MVEPGLSAAGTVEVFRYSLSGGWGQKYPCFFDRFSGFVRLAPFKLFVDMAYESQWKGPEWISPLSTKRMMRTCSFFY
jgi:hypothetical protein